MPQLVGVVAPEVWFAVALKTIGTSMGTQPTKWSLVHVVEVVTEAEAVLG